MYNFKQRSLITFFFIFMQYIGRTKNFDAQTKIFQKINKFMLNNNALNIHLVGNIKIPQRFRC